MLDRSIGAAVAAAISLVARRSVSGADGELWKPGPGLGTVRFDASGGAGGFAPTASGGSQAQVRGAGGFSNGGFQATGGVQGLGGVVASTRFSAPDQGNFTHMTLTMR